MINTRNFWLALLATNLFAVNVVSAGDLNDSIQLYFDGDLAAAKTQLTELIKNDDADPRLYYFRGLSNARLGDRAAADADFEKGAQLELTSTSAAVGQSLQRVQGAERLRLEKHRRMAKLKTRRRVQPVAPRPIKADDQVKLTVGVATDGKPTFRLASEVPLRRAQLLAPYSDEPLKMLAKEQQPTGPAVSGEPASLPVGTGVANAATSDVFEADPFALDTEDPAPAARTSMVPKSAGVFGAVFRAIRKATIPQFDASALLPRGIAPENGDVPQAQDRFPADSFPAEDPFSEPLEETSGEDPFGGDDPFE